MTNSQIPRVILHIRHGVLEHIVADIELRVWLVDWDTIITANREADEVEVEVDSDYVEEHFGKQPDGLDM